MPQTDRSGGFVTFAQAIGIKDNTLELNTFEQATCHACGCEPRLHTTQTEKGLTVAVWIPLEHSCSRIKRSS
jgi:hypothetical protein